MAKPSNFNRQYPLPQSKFYVQWRAGRTTLVTGIMASVFMLGGIMVNLMLLGLPFWAYAVAAVTFAATAWAFVIDQKAIGLRPLTVKETDNFITNPAANSDQDNRQDAKQNQAA